MSPERFQQVMGVFQAACQLAGPEREAVLSRECGEDSALRDEVRALLDCDSGHDARVTVGGGAARFMELEEHWSASVGGVSGAEPGPSVLPPLSQQYRVTRMIGEGGMGTVYEAEQAIPRRTVALKAIRPELLSHDALRRFEREAHVLGRLQHPGIAQIYEAGCAGKTRGARAYLAMEFVDGPTVTQYADERSLDTRARLDLLARVCDAVQHAHQRGVIHRDLKPGNILVCRHTGQPKVLDFGVARVFDSDAPGHSMHTSVGQIIGTLAYMSPEQVTGDSREIDTRSDVYALGVMLYQLLARRLPHDLSGQSMLEAMRVIRTEATPHIGGTSRAFRGEINTITAKALEKDKTRRYQSAAELADDIRRFLAGEPILATRDRLYVLGKQFMRYRWAVAVAAFVIAGLIVFAAYASVQAGRQATLAAAERVAHAQAVAARQLADARSEELEQALYASRIANAQHAALNGDLVRARAQLEACRPADRGWEWRHILHLTDQSKARYAFEGEIRNGAISLDGSAFYSVDSHGVVRQCDARTGTTLRRFESDAKYIEARPSPDHSRLACAEYRKGIDVFDIGTGARTLRIARPDQPSTVDGLAPIGWSNDGRSIIAAGRHGGLFAFDADTGTVSRYWPVVEGQFYALACSPTEPIVACTTSDGHARVFDLSTGDQLASLSLDNQAISTCLSHDGHTIALGMYDRRILLWKWRESQQVMQLKGAETPAGYMTFVHNDGMLVVAGRAPVVDAWSVATGTLQWRQVGETRQIRGLFPLPDDTLLTAGLDGLLRQWSPSPRPTAPSVPTKLSSVFSFESSGLRDVLVASRVGNVGRVDGDTLTVSLLESVPKPSPRAIFELSDGSIHAVCDSGQACTWPPPDGRPINCTDIQAEPSRACRSRDGRTLALFCREGRVVLLQVPGWQQIGAFDCGATAIGGSCMAADGSLYIGDGMTGQIQHWTQDGRKLGEPLQLEGRVQSLCLSPDESTLVAGSTDGYIRVWRLPDGTLIRPQADTGSEVVSAIFLRDGTRFVTTHADGKARVWMTRTGAEIMSMRGSGAPLSAVIQLRSREDLATVDMSGEVRFWEVSATP